MIAGRPHPPAAHHLHRGARKPTRSTERVAAFESPERPRNRGPTSHTPSGPDRRRARG
jgi:hypothetical protein